MSRPHHSRKSTKFRRIVLYRRLIATLVIVVMIISLTACGNIATSTPTSSGGQPATSVATGTAPTPTSPPATAQAVTPTPTVTPSPSPAASPETTTVTLNLYFMRSDKLGVAHRTVAKTPQIGKAALEELLKGPSSQEQAAGLSTAIPAGTTLLGLAIVNNVATVNLSSEYASGGGSLSVMARLAQVVYTLTQFSTVGKVSFMLNNKPVTTFSSEGLILDHPVGRSDYEDVTPAILVETPAVGDTIASPVRLTGTSNTFEAAFTIDVVDANGNVLQEQHAQATAGSGTRGTFDVTVPFKVKEQQSGKVEVFELSAKDGSKINVVDIPVTLSPPK